MNNRSRLTLNSISEIDIWIRFLCAHAGPHSPGTKGALRTALAPADDIQVVRWTLERLRALIRPWTAKPAAPKGDIAAGAPSGRSGKTAPAAAPYMAAGDRESLATLDRALHECLGLLRSIPS